MNNCMYAWNDSLCNTCMAGYGNNPNGMCLDNASTGTPAGISMCM